MQISVQRYQRGVNLIEVMIAMAIGLFLVLGATTLYVNSKKTADIDESVARLQETARYALSSIESDVRMSNYWGMKKDGADFDNKDANLSLPTGTNAGAYGASTSTNYCGAVYATNTEAYVEATNNRYNFNCTKSTAASTADTLTVRRANANTTNVASTSQLRVCSTRKSSTLIKGGTTCPNGEVHNLIVDGYYVDRGSDQSSTYPSLRRQTLIDGPTFQDVEIAPGVEDMQIELGWDDSNADSAGAVRYIQPEASALTSGTCVLAGTGATLGTCKPVGRIIAVRVWLLIRSENRDGAFTDTRTYTYADRTGTATATLTAGRAYAPADNYRRILVSRTFFIRNVTGT